MRFARGDHHDPAITTGVAAYAYGMQRVEDDLSPEKIGRPFFISLLIAPLFPAYGHSRRVSCDAFGRLEDTEYLLSAVTFGWWTNGTLYQFNDPDRTVISRDADPYHGSAPPGSIQTLKEARSRVDASIITGTVLLDSDDLIDPRAQQRAEEITHQRRYSRRCARGAQLPTGRGRRQHASLKTLHAKRARRQRVGCRLQLRQESVCRSQSRSYSTRP